MKPDSHASPARRPRWRLAFDVGFEQDPTALALVRRVLPNVLLPLDRDGVPWDADLDAPLELRAGTTLAQHMAPRYEVADLQRRTGLTFEAIAAEAKRIVRMLAGDGGIAVLVDATGVGRGAVEAIQRAGVRCTAVTITGGHRITGNNRVMRVPHRALFETTYAALAEERLLVAAGLNHAGTWSRELLAAEMHRTPTGQVHYEIQAEGGHGDLAVAVALALVHAERAGPRRLVPTPVSDEESVDAPRTRPRGRPRHGNAARRRIEELRAEREERWRQETDLTKPLGWP